MNYPDWLSTLNYQDPAGAVRQADLRRSQVWGTLIILDACRYDVFAQAVEELHLGGWLIKADSGARETCQWYRTQWSGKHDDVILIANQPVAWKHGDYAARFHQAVLLADYDGWPNPLPVLDEAARIAALPNFQHRLLVHLVPPHLPYWAPQGLEFTQELKRAGFDEVTCYTVRDYGRANGWEKPRLCYWENVLETLRCIVAREGLPQPVVISADHAEIIGEGGDYIHNRDLPGIQIVPWFELQVTDMAIIDQRLKDLGYY